MHDADKVMLMTFQNVDTRHLTYLLPVVEENIKGIAIVYILEDNDVFAELGPKIVGVHTVAKNEFGWMETIKDIGTSLNLMLACRGGVVQVFVDFREGSVHGSWREDFPTDGGDAGQFLIGDRGVENVTVTTLFLEQIDGKEEVFPEILMRS